MGETPNDDRELRNLMTQYQRADPAALDELVGRISPPLLRYFGASRFGQNAAENLLQDCWMRIHRSRHTYRASDPVMPWIYAIARHTRLRQKLGLTKAALAQKIGINVNTLWRWERGDRKPHGLHWKILADLMRDSS
jgi:hypothetical protein